MRKKKASNYYGYVGDMYGVGNQSIFNLLLEYVPNNAVNLLTCDFDIVKRFLSNGYPVWGLTNSTFKALPIESFDTFYTDFEKIMATEESKDVLLTGYDKDYVYFNDFFGKESQVNIDDFIA